MQSWKQLEGKSLAGTYPLMRLSRTESDRAWFATTHQGRPATACIVQAGTNEDALVANLEAASRLRHPNLLTLARVGRARVEGTPVVYAITEAAEENLADVLRERPLDYDETVQITECVVAALGTLHERGLCHGAVSAANLFAADETVKLRSDCIQKAPDGQRNSNDVCAQDMGDLGALIFESLTQRQLASPDEPAIETLPIPFRAIVRKAVMGRWGVTEINAALKKPSMEPRHPVPAMPRAASAKVGLIAKRAMPASGVYGRSSLLSLWSGRTRFLALMALLASVATGWLIYDGNDRPEFNAGRLVTPGVAMPAAQAAPQFSAVQEMVAGDSDVGKHEIWRVVVFTYARESDAQAKVDSLEKLHPELKPEVFSANGESPYSVTLGGRMDRDEALFYRDRVSDAGLPVDVSSQNKSR